MRTGPQTADIFCHVVDNHGDASIAWALAQQLQTEHGTAVQLFIDKPEALSPLAPALDPATATQTVNGVQVLHWTDRFPPGVIPADLVIEILSAEAPDTYKNAAAKRRPKPPVWIIYEYLSAEDWIDTHHLLPSPHPATGLLRHYFYPGFTPHSGGLLWASNKPARRDSFQGDIAAQNTFWANIGLPPRAAGEHRLSLFGYENQSVPSLLHAIATGDTPTTVIAPHSRISADVQQFMGTDTTRGALTIHQPPFLPRDRFEYLLWACDLNFVRGEESLTSAVMSARPLLWHIYPQDEGLHLQKLAAFCARYAPDSPLPAAMQAWNTNADMGPHWQKISSNFKELNRTSEIFADKMRQIGNACQNMVDFYRKIG